jgi:hypothetical protein
MAPPRTFAGMSVTTQSSVESAMAEWRSAAKRVSRAWEAWLASEDAERDWAHEVYLDALAREEAAAARLECDIRGLSERSP